MRKEQLVDYEAESGRMLSPPRQVFLDLTSRCNLDCVMCSVDYGRVPLDVPAGDMSLSTVDRLRPWLVQALSVNLNIVGEPLIHPRFREVLGLIDSREPRIHFNTNGLGLSPSMCEQLVARPVGSVAVSVDGMQSNEAIRGVPYRIVRERIVNLLRARRARGSRHPYVGVAYTLMRRNLLELPQVLEDLLPLGIDMVHVQPLIVFYEALAGENPYDVPAVDEVLGRCETIAARHGARFTTFRSRFSADERYAELDEEALQVGGTSRRFGCVDPFYEIKVRFDGQVLSCSYGLSFGLNVHDLDLDSIWNHESYRLLRRRLHEGRFEGRCDGCPYIFGSRSSQVSPVRPGVRHSREARFFSAAPEDLPRVESAKTGGSP